MAHSVLSDHRLALLGAEADLRHEWRRDETGRFLGQPHEVAQKASARIWIFDGKTLEAGPAFPLETPFPVFDRFPDGRWVVASARTRLDQDQNARVLSPDGQLLRRIRLGDGIMQLKIDAGGAIWVGWFDEGVFGNAGWTVANLEWPPSAYGLVAFDDAGAPLRAADGAPAGSEIADCYALNVVGETAWACTYPDFPVSRSAIDADSRWWSTYLAGPRALAVSLPHVLLAGGYGGDGDRLSLGRLDETGFAPVDEWRLPFNVGFPDRVDFADGRGDRLHIVNDGIWHVWTLDQFL